MHFDSKPAVTQQQPTSKPASTPSFKGVSVLLVEDDRVIRELLARMLKTIGISDVTEASTAEAGWAHLTGDERRHFHVVITDLSLPGVSGGTMIRKIRALPSTRAKSLPIIVLTGSTDLTDFNRLRNDKVSSYLIKPISVDLLRTALERALYPDRAADDPLAASA